MRLNIRYQDKREVKREAEGERKEEVKKRER